MFEKALEQEEKTLAAERGRSPSECVGHGWMTEGVSPLWSPLEATMSWRQLHEAEANIMSPRSFP